MCLNQLCNDAKLNNELFSIDGIGDKEIMFSEMESKVHHVIT